MDGGMTTKIKGDATSTFGSDIDVTGNVVTDAPAFRAYKSSSSEISHNTWTKVQFDEETFDTNSNYDNSTNYRFTPTVEGYYQINSCVHQESNGAGKTPHAVIRKNGSDYAVSNLSYQSAAVNVGLVLSTLVYMNGSTDYVEVYVYHNSGDSRTNYGGSSGHLTNFSGHLVRAV
jgi:hypothetical protein